MPKHKWRLIGNRKEIEKLEITRMLESCPFGAIFNTMKSSTDVIWQNGMITNVNTTYLSRVKPILCIICQESKRNLQHSSKFIEINDSNLFRYATFSDLVTLLYKYQ